MKRLTIVLVATLALVGCGKSGHPEELRNDSGSVFKLLDVDIDLDGKTPSITLNFKNMDTDKAVNETADSGDATGDDKNDVKNLMHKMDYLNVGECYTDPMSAQNYKQVPCG